MHKTYILLIYGIFGAVKNSILKRNTASALSILIKIQQNAQEIYAEIRSAERTYVSASDISWPETQVR